MSKTVLQTITDSATKKKRKNSLKTTSQSSQRRALQISSKTNLAAPLPKKKEPLFSNKDYETFDMHKLGIHDGVEVQKS